MRSIETTEPYVPAAGKLSRALTAHTNGALTFADIGVFAGLRWRSAHTNQNPDP
jgi:hypothetical protein